jgi:hypothetical protein
MTKNVGVGRDMYVARNMVGGFEWLIDCVHGQFEINKMWSWHRAHAPRRIIVNSSAGSSSSFDEGVIDGRT